MSGLSLYKPDIVKLVRHEGVELRHKNRHLWALCPLPGHTERTPSFKVDHERQSFYCFGCNRGGDSIAFIREYKGLSFKDTLDYLGLLKDRQPPSRDQVQRAAKDRELVAAFNMECREIANGLYDRLRRLDRLKMKLRDMKDVERLAYWCHREPLWEYWIGVLEGKDEKAKYELYKEVKRNGGI